MIGSDIMKIERLSENQIRCTLNKSDLASRQLKISELAYGSEKARELFRDMMQQASHELGFEADDIPLMIEAIPVSSDCIVLIVTKVDDPEELDTRFSKFSPSSMDDYDDDYPYGDDMEVIESDNYELPTASDELDALEANQQPAASASQKDEDSSSDILNLFSKVKDYLNQSITDTDSNHTKPFIPLGQTLSQKKDSTSASAEPTEPAPPTDNTIIRVFQFQTLDAVSEASRAVQSVYNDYSSFFKKQKDGKYYLVLKRTNCPAVNFNKTCNILSEFGTRVSSNPASLSYFEEHAECISSKHAIQIMARL